MHGNSSKSSTGLYCERSVAISVSCFDFDRCVFSRRVHVAAQASDHRWSIETHGGPQGPVAQSALAPLFQARPPIADGLWCLMLLNRFLFRLCFVLFCVAVLFTGTFRRYDDLIHWIFWKGIFYQHKNIDHVDVAVWVLIEPCWRLLEQWILRFQTSSTTYHENKCFFLYDDESTHINQVLRFLIFLSLALTTLIGRQRALHHL